MIDLLRAEFLRVASRRVAWIVLIAAVAVAALVAVSGSSATRPLDATDHALAQEQFQEYQEGREETCREYPEECGDEFDLAVTDFLREVMDYEDYISSANEVGLLFVALGAVLAAALVGGEFRTGAIATQLTFTPRRIPVMMAKLLVATASGVAVVLAYLTTVTVIGTISFLMLRGASDLTASVEMPLLLLRLLLASALVSALAAALAFVVASTLLAVGLGLVALIVSEFIVTGYGHEFPSWLWLLPTPNLMVLLYRDYEYVRWDPVLMTDVPTILMGFWQAVVYGAVLVLVTTVVGALVFRRRDLLR